MKRSHRLLSLFLSSLFLLPFSAGCSASSETGTETAVNTTTEEPSQPPTEPPTEAPTEPPVTYLVMSYFDDKEGLLGEFDSLTEAAALADENAVYGVRVYDSNGEAVYYPYTELQCDILREAKAITDYCRENNFTYGDAPINPAIDHTAKKVSCDRLVGWVMYNVGFTNQPRVQGVVVSAMTAWCEKQGFEKIVGISNLQPGDIVLVKPQSGIPAHTFIYAGRTESKTVFYRYDCGSDVRIQSVQPFSEQIFSFMYAYRPVKNSANS